MRALDFGSGTSHGIIGQRIKFQTLFFEDGQHKVAKNIHSKNSYPLRLKLRRRVPIVERMRNESWPEDRDDHHSFVPNEAMFVKVFHADEPDANASRSRTKLSSRDAIAIFNQSLPRQMQLSGGQSGNKKRPSAVAISREYGVNEKTVRDIWRGRTWYA